MLEVGLLTQHDKNTTNHARSKKLSFGGSGRSVAINSLLGLSSGGRGRAWMLLVRSLGSVLTKNVTGPRKIPVEMNFGPHRHTVARTLSLPFEVGCLFHDALATAGSIYSAPPAVHQERDLVSSFHCVGGRHLKELPHVWAPTRLMELPHVWALLPLVQAEET